MKQNDVRKEDSDHEIVDVRRVGDALLRAGIDYHSLVFLVQHRLRGRKVSLRARARCGKYVREQKSVVHSQLCVRARSV